MFRLMVRSLTRYFDHPLLMGLLLLAAVFVLVAGVLQFAMEEPFAAAFMAVFATIWAFLGGFGYVALLFSKVVSRIQRQFRFA